MRGGNDGDTGDLGKSSNGGAEVLAEHSKLTTALPTDDWARLLPGKLIFSRFCGEFFRVDDERVREAYADVAVRVKSPVFNEIAAILSRFASVTPVPG